MKMYHRKDGKIVDRNDDMISATRYACIMMSRHGKPGGAINTGYWYDSSKPLTPAWFQGVV